MIIYCILTGLLVYYIALWLWYRYTDSRTSTGRTDDAPLPRNGVSGYTLIGESRYKGGLIGTAQDKSGHLPQAAENDTIFAPQADGLPEETPGYENDEPDYEDEEIAGRFFRFGCCFRNVFFRLSVSLRRKNSIIFSRLRDVSRFVLRCPD